MCNIVICDDEEHICHTLCKFLNQFQKETGEEYYIQYFSSGEKLIKEFPIDTDILLLDIKMDQLTGMEVARILRSQNNNVCIIFITTMVNYALEGYEVHASGFVKKPLVYEQFKKQLTEALRSLAIQNDCFITFKNGMEIVRININDIYYFESYGHHIRIVSKNGIEETHISLSEYEKKLKTNGFFRCHKSYIINLRHVQRINYSTLNMPCNNEILLSKHRRKELLTVFARFVGDRL